MSEEVEKKSGIFFTYVRSDRMTTIAASAFDSELPQLAAIIDMVEESKIWRVRITNFKNACPIFDAVCYRGRSFAERVARFAIRGCYSRLGKKRRATANKQKIAEVK